MQAAYAATVLAEPLVVIGKRLEPFSVGHAHILEAIGSPFMTGEKVEFTDFVLAVWVCSRIAFSESRFLLPTTEAAEKECRKWGIEFGGCDFVSELAKFNDYLASHSLSPKRWKKGAESALRVPWTLAVFWRICGGRLNSASESFAWNLPLPFAISYNAAALAMSGDDSLMSEEEATAIQTMKDQNGASCNTSKD